jgi:hypothetical protein
MKLVTGFLSKSISNHQNDDEAYSSLNIKHIHLPKYKTHTPP